MKYAAFFMMLLVIVQLLFVHVKLPDARPCECPKPTPKPCPHHEEIKVIEKDDTVIVIEKDDTVIVIEKDTSYYTYHDSKRVENNLLLVLHTIKEKMVLNNLDAIKFNNALRIDGQVQYYD